MKKIVLFSILTCLCLFVNCSAQAPEEVKKAFEEKYPGEKHSNWKIDRNGNYESHFKKDGKKYRADFTPQGIWIETERSIKKKELPELVRQKLKSDYDDYEIVELEETRHHSKGLFYDVELKKDGKKQDVEFNVAGKILN